MLPEAATTWRLRPHLIQGDQPWGGGGGGGGGDQWWECNLAAVWGQMSTGGDQGPLAEMTSVLGVPVMTKRSFMATEKISWSVMAGVARGEHEGGCRGGKEECYREGVIP